jgi:putative endonuclease
MERYHKIFGKRGEDAAERYLKKRGYRIIARNFNIRGGEIDIVAQKRDCVVFAEVKTRSDNTFGTPGEAVTYTKRQRVIKAAEVFLMRNGSAYARFDVIEVFGRMDGSKFTLAGINHIENAFAVE